MLYVMIPGPLRSAFEHVERSQAEMDVEERIRSLEAMQNGTSELLGRIRTYLNDAQLEREGAAARRRAGMND